MPIWLQIVIAVLNLIFVILAGIGFTAYFAERAKHKAQKKNDAEDKAEAEEEARQQKIEELIEKEFMDKLVNALADVMAEKLKPMISEALKPVVKDLQYVKAGVQDVCRNDLEDLVAKGDSQKWLSRYDKDRFEHMYNSYHNLGENGVMDSNRERLLKLPERPPVKKQGKKSK